MKLIISPRAEKQFKKLPKVTQIILAKNIKDLTNFSQNSNSTKLKGFQNIYRIRIGNYRIVFKRTTKEIYIILIGHRKEIYKMLNNLLK